MKMIEIMRIGVRSRTEGEQDGGVESSFRVCVLVWFGERGGSWPMKAVSRAGSHDILALMSFRR